MNPFTANDSKFSFLPIGLGTMGFGGYFSADDTFLDEQTKLIEIAHELGVRVLDTAEVYGEGMAENIIGRLPKHIKNEMFVMSKFSGHRTSKKEICSALDQTLRRIKRHHVDVYQPHWPNPNFDLEEILDCLSELRKAGKIRFIGVSNFNRNALPPNRAANAPSFLQCEFNPVNQTQGLELLDYANGCDGIVVGYSPFQEGKIFSSKHMHELEVLSKQLNCTVAQLLLSWVTSHERAITIPKTTSIIRLQENIKAASIKLSKETIDTVSNLLRIEVKLLDPRQIIPFDHRLLDTSDRPVYRTVEEAIENRFNLSPSPKDIAAEIELNGGELNKPLKVRQDGAGQFILVEGRLRYWGWIILFGSHKAIPVTILPRNEQ